MKNVAVIGAGQLGSRHLQALALSPQKLNVYVIDPVDHSLHISKLRFEQVDQIHNKRLFLKKTIKELPPEIDFAIIATNSLQRLMVLKQLLHHSSVKFLLLEKFLFPRINEYEEAQRIITKFNVITYVNCARRAWPNYQEIQKLLRGDSTIKLIVNGDNWNLASNSIHFFDLFCYLTGENNVSLNVKELDTTLLDNKREGYIEFSGTLSGHTGNGNEFRFTSNVSDEVKVNILIESDQRKYEINEMTEEIKILNREKTESVIKEFKLFHQSVLTNKILKQLSEDGNCDLVSFEESKKHHLTLLNAFNKFLDGREGVIT